jgi:hypothetical protein
MNATSRPFILAVALLSGAVAAARPETRTVFVTAVDGKDVPVAGLTAADLTVKEDGKVRQIDRVELATAPMQIALMLDDGGVALGAIRQSAGQFVERLQNKAEFMLITTGGGRNVTLVNPTPDPRIVYAALQKVFARNQPATPDGMMNIAATRIKLVPKLLLTGHYSAPRAACPPRRQRCARGHSTTSGPTTLARPRLRTGAA